MGDLTNADLINSFKENLNKEIKKRIRYTSWDFKLAHTLLWLSILASFSSAIIIASDKKKIDNIYIAIIAGTPGLVIVIEKHLILPNGLLGT